MNCGGLEIKDPHDAQVWSQRVDREGGEATRRIRWVHDSRLRLRLEESFRWEWDDGINNVYVPLGLQVNLIGRLDEAGKVAAESKS